MRTTNKIITMSLMVLGMAISGCSDKKDDPAPTPTPAPEPTKTELLTGKNWKMTAFTSNPAINWDGSGTMVTDVYAQMSSCDKDDISVFNVNNTYTDDEGATKCDPADPQTTSGTWVFNPTQTILTLDGTDSYNIEALSSSSLKLNQVYNDGTTNYTFTFTFTKQ